MQLPQTLNQHEQGYLNSKINKIERDYQRITPAQCASIMADVLPFFWEKQLPAEALMRQQAIWYSVLNEYSEATVTRVAMEWLKHSKRAPTPSDFLDLCTQYDTTPDEYKRLRMLAALPVREELVEPHEPPMKGCPFQLMRLQRIAREQNIGFTVEAQMDYLAHGDMPIWADTGITASEENQEVGTAKELPTREELLAHMTQEEQRLAMQLPKTKV